MVYHSEQNVGLMMVDYDECYRRRPSRITASSWPERPLLGEAAAPRQVLQVSSPASSLASRPAASQSLSTAGGNKHHGTVWSVKWRGLRGCTVQLLTCMHACFHLWTKTHACVAACGGVRKRIS